MSRIAREATADVGFGSKPLVLRRALKPLFIMLPTAAFWHGTLRRSRKFQRVGKGIDSRFPAQAQMIITPSRDWLP